MRGITNADDAKHIAEIIKKHIVPSEGYNPDNTEGIDVIQASTANLDRLVECIFDFYITRTRAHVALVQKFAEAVAKVHADQWWADKLVEQAKDHDKDKLEDIEFAANYAPYLVKKYGPPELTCNFEVTDAYKKLWEEKFVVQHCKNNKHHPEYWDKSYDFGENNPPYTPKMMDEVSISEAVCDWLSVGKEMGNTAMSWFEKTNGKRWIWSNSQKAFILDILKDESRYKAMAGVGNVFTDVTKVIGENIVNAVKKASQESFYPKRCLFTYVPKINTVTKDGVYGPCGDSEEELVNRYGKRANSKNKQGVLDWLDSTFPGRSKCISVMTEPIPNNASPKQLAFRDSSTLVILPPYEELKRVGIAVDLWKPHIDGPGSDHVSNIDYSPINWTGKEGKLTFSGVKHYFIVTKDGYIPPKYCKTVEVSNEVIITPTHTTVVLSQDKVVDVPRGQMIETSDGQQLYCDPVTGDIKYLNVDVSSEALEPSTKANNAKYVWAINSRDNSNAKSIEFGSEIYPSYQAAVKAYTNPKVIHYQQQEAMGIPWEFAKQHVLKVGKEVYLGKKIIRHKDGGWSVEGIRIPCNILVWKPLPKVDLAKESLEASTEALPANFKEKRKKIEKYIIDSIKQIDRHTSINSDYWSNKFKSMSDADFDRMMHLIKEGKYNIHMFVPPLKVKLKNAELVDACHKLGVKLMHRIWMTDESTGMKYLTPEEYMVLQLPVRRQQQFLDEKLSVPDNDKTIDGLTGQVTGDSKACAITNPEIQILQARNLDASLYEYANVRGGNIHNYAEFKRSLEETGSVSLNALDPNNRTRVAVMGGVLLTSMMIENNLMEE